MAAPCSAVASQSGSRRRQSTTGIASVLLGWGWFRSYDDRAGPGSTPRERNLGQLGRPYAARAWPPRTTRACSSSRSAPSPPAAAAWRGRPTARSSSSATPFPGERVRARVTASTSSYLRADAVEILTPSPDRVEPPCPHAGPGPLRRLRLPARGRGRQRRLKAFRIAEQLERLAGVERAVEVEAVPGDADGLGWRTRVRLAVDGRGAVGFRRHRSHRLEHVDECPSPARRWRRPAPSAPCGPAPPSSRWSPGPSRREAVVSVTPRRQGRAAPARRSTPVSSCGGKVRREPGAVHAGVGGRTYRISPGRLLAGPHRRRRRRCWRRSSTLVGDCDGATRGRPLRRRRPLLRPAGPRGRARRARSSRSSGTGAPAPTPGTTAPTFPTCGSLEAEVTPELVASGIGRPDSSCSTRPARAPAPRSCVPSPRHAATVRTAGLRLVRPGVVRPRRPRSCSTRAGTSPRCGPSTSSP